MLDRDGLNQDLGPAKEHVTLTARFRTDLPFDHNCELHEIRSADPALDPHHE